MKVKAIKNYNLLKVEKGKEYNACPYYDVDSKQYIYFINNEYITEPEFSSIFKILKEKII